MPGIAASHAPRKVVIVGGGFAAVEALLALRALLGEHVDLTLVSASERFSYRPAATAEVFGSAKEAPLEYPLARIAADLGATLRHDRLEAVASSQHTIWLASHASLRYDSLILALGARTRAAIPGALTFRDQRDVSQMKALLRDLRSGQVRRLAFAVPSGCAWPLPMYELALLTAMEYEGEQLGSEISVVSPEASPLEVFGEQASRVLRELLSERGVRFIGECSPAEVRRDGTLLLHFGGVVPADRVVAAPQLRGPRLGGVPSRWWSFVPVDAEGCVEGLADVYAAGDMTDLPVKQSGLAAVQADLIAHVIAAGEGMQVSVPSAVQPGRLLEAQLLGGSIALALKARLSAAGTDAQTAGGGQAPARHQAPRSSEKVAGRHLRAYLSGIDTAGRRLRPERGTMRSPRRRAPAPDGA